MRIVQTDAGIEKIALADDHHHHDEKGHKHSHGRKKTAHGHDKAHRHDHAGAPDPHVWLSPLLVKTQARHIADALASPLIPPTGQRYEENLNGFLREIDALDAELKAMFAGSPGAQFMVFHPSWGYFAQAYGLKQVPIEIEGKDAQAGPAQRADPPRAGARNPGESSCSRSSPPRAPRWWRAKSGGRSYPSTRWPPTGPRTCATCF
jgi:zinc transport system substrate-binding protein